MWKKSIQLFLERLFVSLPIANLTSAPIYKTAACGVFTTSFRRHLRCMVKRLLGWDGAQFFQAHWETEAMCFWRQESKACSTYAAHGCLPETLLECSCGKVAWVAGQFVPVAIAGRLLQNTVGTTLCVCLLNGNSINFPILWKEMPKYIK